MSKNPITMAEVIDRLFVRLAASYGAEWTRQWNGIPIGDAKTAWGHELSGYINHLPAIAHALDNLPERCPNVIQFRNLCRSAPARSVVMIDAPKADPERVKAVLATMTQPQLKVDGKEWARRIVAENDPRRMYRHKLAVAALRYEFSA